MRSKATCAWLLGLCLALGSVSASESVTVVIEGCGTIDSHEVDRLVALELSTVLAERGDAPFPPVRVECNGAWMKIVVRDPVTAKTLERELPAPKPGEPGRERTLALAVSQLFLSSWTELLLPPPKAPVGPPESARGSKAAHAVVKQAVTPIVITPEFDLTFVGGARVRDLAAPFPLLSGGLRMTMGLGSGLRGWGGLGGESGRARRARGDVDVSLFTVGLGVGYRSRGAFGLQALAGVELSALRLDGSPSLPSATGSAARAFVADATLAVGPVLSLGPLLLGLEARAGYLLPSVVGEVARERSVTPSGAWLGGALTLGVAFGGLGR